MWAAPPRMLGSVWLVAGGEPTTHCFESDSDDEGFSLPPGWRAVRQSAQSQMAKFSFTDGQRTVGTITQAWELHHAAAAASDAAPAAAASAVAAAATAAASDEGDPTERIEPKMTK